MFPSNPFPSSIAFLFAYIVFMLDVSGLVITWQQTCMGIDPFPDVGEITPSGFSTHMQLRRPEKSDAHRRIPTLLRADHLSA